jgi:hypothetical protein
MLTCDIDGDIKAYTATIDYWHWLFLGQVFQLTVNNKSAGVLLPLASLSRWVYDSLLPPLTIPCGYCDE